MRLVIKRAKPAEGCQERKRRSGLMGAWKEQGWRPNKDSMRGPN
jgi:hypothetical protein